MLNILLMLLAVSSLPDFSLPSMNTISEKMEANNKVLSQSPTLNTELNQIKDMFHREASTLSDPVINKVITTLKCAIEYNVDRNNIVTIIDYSLPSNEKRLWVFDLNQKKLLYNTYVSHGIRSGTLLTSFFSNKFNSKASSIGVYKTEKAYYGREGLSLRLEGLERNFNDNASSRSVVMHGGWYVEEDFIKRYGRPGRSWGCPALPLALYQPIINTIKDKSLLVIYYPSDDWFVKSRFLTCDMMNHQANMSVSPMQAKPSTDTSDSRDAILFADLRGNNRHEEDDPVLVMSTDNYEHIFHAPTPLSRMLRRQINNAEYVAISTKEFNRIVAENNQEALRAIGFVVPHIIMVRGYYETQMKLLNMGQIKNVRTTSSSSESNGNYFVNFESRAAVNLKSSSHFIRWVGL